MDESFRQREQSYEAKYKMDEELRFKAESRRNKLLGLWAAEKMGLAKADQETYAKSVVVADFDEPGSDDVVRKVKGDFDARNIPISADQIKEEMIRLYAVALDQIAKEFPKALG
jgi:hypothetical protein